MMIIDHGWNMEDAEQREADRCVPNLASHQPPKFKGL